MLTLVSGALGLTHQRAILFREWWMKAAAACRHLAGDGTARRRKVHASSVSHDWLRSYAIESAKHLEDR